jgi:outer membrane lipoprotein LolB
MRLATGFTLAFMLFIGACSTTPPRAIQPASVSANSVIQNWQIQGKIGLRGDDFAESAYINWQQCGEQFSIQLNGPLGSGAVRLNGNPQLTTIMTSNETIVTEAPERLLQQHYGWHIPIDSMLFWLRGLPAPNIHADMTDTGFIQNGWTVNYLRFLSAEDKQLPGKMIAQNPQLKITLIIKDWQLQPACQ